MAIGFVQALGTAQSKVAGTSLVISPASKTVTVGNSIFVGFSLDDAGASAISVIDNLGNTYTVPTLADVTNSGAVRSQLWKAPVTTGGSITSITIGWTGSITAKAGVAGEFSGVGAENNIAFGQGVARTDGFSNAGQSSATFIDGGAIIGVWGVEDDVPAVGEGRVNGTPSQTVHEVGSIGTSGGASASNISATLGYILFTGTGTGTCTLLAVLSGNQNSAGTGSTYDVTFTATDGTATAPKGVWDPHLVPKAWF